MSSPFLMRAVIVPARCRHRHCGRFSQRPLLVTGLITRLIFGLALLISGWSAAWARAQPAIVATDGFNLVLTKSTATDLTTTPANPGYAHNWFAGRFSGLAAGQETTLRIDMKGNDTTGNKADVGKWNGLRPFYTYADPNRYEAYLTYTKNEQGVWVSSDPFARAAARFAGRGATPAQNLMPAAVAAEFLSADGQSWFPWREIKTAKPGGGNTFVIRHAFALPWASVVMRLPFTYTYCKQFMGRLQAAVGEGRLSGISIDEIGETADKRKLWCIRVEDPTGMAPVEDLKTVVVFAREHATEHASSWAAVGVLLGLLDNSLATEELRMKVRFLIVPLQDPDGSADSRFEGLTNRWDDPQHNTRLQEVLAYSAYFRDFVEKGHTIDAAVSIHNVEANEAPNLMSPFAQDYFRKSTVELNRGLFEAGKAAGYTTSGPEPHGSGGMSTRLFGWLAQHLGAMDVAYEVNDRHPGNRLTLGQLQSLGALTGREIGRWLLSAEGDKRHAQARESLKARARRKQEYYQAQGDAGEDAKARRFDLLIKGF